ncbi:MAG TPA: tetratricopeptide repeat protein [Pedobacter sp.]
MANPNTLTDGELMLDQIQDNFKRNQKKITGVVVALIVVVGGFFGYRYYTKSQEEKAAAALFPAERFFEVDSFRQVLDGDGQHPGVLTIIKKYSGTDAANQAQYFAGMSLLHTGKFQEAIDHLTRFNGKGTSFEFLAYGAMGDAYMEMKNTAKGIEYYAKAAKNEKDQYVAPLYLFRAGLASEKAGNLKDAAKYYNQVRMDYPQSIQARDIDKYLARVGELNNND